MSIKWEAVIGLEIHLQLNTKTKAWCNCSTDYNDSKMNVHTCPVCLGHPGALPKLNNAVVDKAIKAALALDCKINKVSTFDRKNYFYPDLTKGYQITQFYKTYAESGNLSVALKNGNKDISITKIQIEEDTGKALHLESESLLNYNRASMPLLEIISGPDMRSSEEAYAYLNQLKDTLKYLDISDLSMEHGSLRCDANISVKPVDTVEFGTRVEVKNLNSFRGVARAIDYEISRQIDEIENGGTIIQETRLWNEEQQVTKAMRSKEEAMDYRYFPESDLPPLVIKEEKISEIQDMMPETKVEKIERFIANYHISETDANILCDEMEIANYFEEVVKVSNNAKLSSNWILTEVLRVLKEDGKSIEEFVMSANTLGEIIKTIDSGKISGKIAKTVFEIKLKDSRTIDEIIEAEGLAQVSDTGALEKIIDTVIANNAKLVEDYHAADEGRKPRVLKGLIGQVMKATKGKANPGVVNKLMIEKLS